MHLWDNNSLAQIFQGMKMQSLLKYFTVHLQRQLAHAEATLTSDTKQAAHQFKRHWRFFVGLSDMFSSCLLLSCYKKVLQGKSGFSCHFVCFLYLWKNNILGVFYGQSIPISKPQSKLEIYRLLTTNLIQLIWWTLTCLDSTIFKNVDVTLGKKGVEDDNTIYFINVLVSKVRVIWVIYTNS